MSPRGHHDCAGAMEVGRHGMKEKRGKEKPSFSRSRAGKEGNTDIDFKTPEITVGTRREQSLVRTAPKR